MLDSPVYVTQIEANLEKSSMSTFKIWTVICQIFIGKLKYRSSCATRKYWVTGDAQISWKKQALLYGLLALNDGNRM